MQQFCFSCSYMHFWFLPDVSEIDCPSSCTLGTVSICDASACGWTPLHICCPHSIIRSMFLGLGSPFRWPHSMSFKSLGVTKHPVLVVEPRAFKREVTVTHATLQITRVPSLLLLSKLLHGVSSNCAYDWEICLSFTFTESKSLNLRKGRKF